MTRKSGLAFAILLAAATACVDALAAGPAAATTAETTSALAQIPAGPKKRISIAKFDANGAFVTVYGSWDIGGGLAAQLTTALVDSGRFIVVERPDLQVVLREQELSKLNITSRDSGPQAGKVLGTQFIVHGSVTEFEQNSSGKNANLGVSGSAGSALNMLGAAVAKNTSNGIVGIDVRLIDPTTSQVLQSKRIEKRLSTSDTSVNLVASQVAFGGEQFDKSVLGRATRAAIEEAVVFIAAYSASLPWTGALADVDGSNVLINAGSDAGLVVGDRFAVVVVAKEVTDPTTGQSLGRIERQAGTVRITSVEPAFSMAVMEEPFAAARGDTVRWVGR
jgi:curli biogenesis system outer membrane secretion channel CsgG